MYPPPPRRRKRKKQVKPKKEEPKAVVEEVEKEESPVVPLAQPELKKNNTENVEENSAVEELDDPVNIEDDPNVLKSEIDDIRKSIVSMSVGQPERTSNIVKEWLENQHQNLPQLQNLPRRILHLPKRQLKINKEE